MALKRSTANSGGERRHWLLSLIASQPSIQRAGGQLNSPVSFILTPKDYHVIMAIL
jgi:hypothetical protein